MLVGAVGVVLSLLPGQGMITPDSPKLLHMLLCIPWVVLLGGHQFQIEDLQHLLATKEIADNLHSKAVKSKLWNAKDDNCI
jgi:hypothetical protein